MTQAVQDEAAVEVTAPAPRRRRNRDVAAGLSVVPGLGQLYNLQPRKAAFFLLATLLTIGPAVLLIMGGERLGSTLLERKQFTAFLLIAFASIVVFLALFIAGLAMWASAAVDARRSAEELSEGRPPTGRWWLFRL